MAGRRPWLRRLLQHLLAFGRLNALGWCTVAFLYYVGFRLLQILWRFFPGFLPAAQVLLKVTLVYLLWAGVSGRLLRWFLRLR